MTVKSIILQLEEEQYITAKYKEKLLLGSAVAIYGERRNEFGLLETMTNPLLIEMYRRSSMQSCARILLVDASVVANLMSSTSC